MLADFLRETIFYVDYNDIDIYSNINDNSNNNNSNDNDNI